MLLERIRAEGERHVPSRVKARRCSVEKALP